MDKNSVTVSTYSGLICGSFCVSFSTNTTIDKMSINSYGYNIKGKKMTICNGVENGHLDGAGTPQSLKFRLVSDYFKPPEYFEVMCDGWFMPRKGSGQDPVYRPEYGHLYKVIGEGGLGKTEKMFEDSMCWPKHVCE